jgi:hypothetical protein
MELKDLQFCSVSFSNGEKNRKRSGCFQKPNTPWMDPLQRAFRFWNQIVEEKISLVRCPLITLFNRRKSIGGRAFDMWNEFSEAYSAMQIAHNFRHVLNDA